MEASEGSEVSSDVMAFESQWILELMPRLGCSVINENIDNNERIRTTSKVIELSSKLLKKETESDRVEHAEDVWTWTV